MHNITRRSAEHLERAARLLEQILKTGDRLRGDFHTLDYLTGISSQCSFIEPCKSIYAELGKLEESSGCMLSFTPGFPSRGAMGGL